MQPIVHQMMSFGMMVWLTPANKTMFDDQLCSSSLHASSWSWENKHSNRCTAVSFFLNGGCSWNWHDCHSRKQWVLTANFLWKNCQTFDGNVHAERAMKMGAFSIGTFFAGRFSLPLHDAVAAEQFVCITVHLKSCSCNFCHFNQSSRAKKSFSMRSIQRWIQRWIQSGKELRNGRCFCSVKFRIWICHNSPFVVSSPLHVELIGNYFVPQTR